MSSNQVLADRAASLLALHQPGNPVILPTVWDAWSAKLAVDAGFSALTVGSHPVADSIGKPDNEGMTFDDLLTRVAQITAAVDVPVSVDIESGYGEAPARLIEGLLDVGAVGFNIEDTVHSEGGRLRSSAEHAELVGALRAAADAAGVHVVINARTDLFIRDDGDEADRVDRAIARLTEAAQAGADVLYPVGRHDPDTLRRLATELPLPINAIALPDQSDPASFGPLGVARISFGPFLQAALATRAKRDSGALVVTEDMWGTGDYQAVAAKVTSIGRRPRVQRAGIEPGMEVLDVACGTGNATIPAATRGGAGDRAGLLAGSARDRPRTRSRREGRSRVDRGRCPGPAIRRPTASTASSP